MYSCELCPKIYKRRPTLRHHKNRVHDGITYPCESCTKVFSHPVGRRLHNLKTHQGLGHPCPNCFQTFTTQTSVRRHLRNFHKPAPPQPTETTSELEKISPPPAISETMEPHTPPSQIPQSTEHTQYTNLLPAITPFQLDEFLKTFHEPETGIFINQLVNPLPQL